MRELSPDGRFEMHTHRRDDDSYMYSDTDYYWWVACIETGDQIAAFSGSDYQRAGSSHQDGTCNVNFDDDFIVAAKYDGPEERVELPSKWRISDDNEQIALTYSDGRSETRKRQPVIATGKYGDAFALTALKPGRKSRR